MLKLEKRSKSSGLTLRMREREGFFEPRLLKALAIALILHMCALVLFHVTPFYFSSTSIFPPIQVEMDSPIQGSSALAALDLEEESILPPPLTLVPALDWFSFSQESTLIPSLTLDLHTFQQIEDQIWPKWQIPPLSLKLEEPRIQLAISGDLAHYPLVTTDPLLHQMKNLSSDESPPAYVTYQVQLDQKTGELFWYERIESSTTAINQLTEKILLNLRFSLPEKRQAIVKGNLHFVVLNSEN